MLLGWLNGSLDLVGVDDLGNVGMGKNAVLEMEVSSSLSFSGESSEVIVESLEILVLFFVNNLPVKHLESRCKVFRCVHLGQGV